MLFTKIARVGETFHVQELYTLTGRQFENHHGGIVCAGNYVYGGHGNSRGEPVCVDVTTGKIAWRGKAPERGSAAGSGPAWAYPVIADGRLYLRHGDLLACYDVRAR